MMCALSLSSYEFTFLYFQKKRLCFEELDNNVLFYVVNNPLIIINYTFTNMQGTHIIIC